MNGLSKVDHGGAQEGGSAGDGDDAIRYGYGAVLQLFGVGVTCVATGNNGKTDGQKRIQYCTKLLRLTDGDNRFLS